MPLAAFLASLWLACAVALGALAIGSLLVCADLLRGVERRPWTAASPERF